MLREVDNLTALVGTVEDTATRTDLIQSLRIYQTKIVEKVQAGTVTNETQLNDLLKRLESVNTLLA